MHVDCATKYQSACGLLVYFLYNHCVSSVRFNIFLFTVTSQHNVYAAPMTLAVSFKNVTD